MPLNEILCILMFVGFIALLFTGFPVAWVLGGLAVVFAAVGWFASAHTGLMAASFYTIDWAYVSAVVDRIWDVMKNWVLVALPLFIFMGLMLDKSGIADDLMNSFARFFGRMRGGYAVTIAIIGILMAASTGIVGASVTLLALLGLPIMLANAYRADLASGTIAAVGTLGILIPPSIMLVLMGDRLALSVGDLFLGALVPGLLLGVLYIVYIVVFAWMVPGAAPAPARIEPITGRALLGLLWAVVPAAGLILAVLGTIFFGIATPTEAAGVGAFGAMLLALAKRRLDVQVVREVCRQTTRTTAFIFAIFLGATAYSLVLRGLGGDELIEGMVKGLPFGKDGIVIAVLLFAFFLGFFLDWIEITLIVLPLVGPIIQNMGYNLVWFTVLFAVLLQTSFLTPPVGFSLFYLKGVAPKEVTVGHIYRGIVPFVLIQLAVVVLVFFWKDLVLWLPSVAYRQ
jgi:tripartite ATP-independent transporter DctM subunit